MRILEVAIVNINMFYVIGTILVSIITIILLYFKWQYTYWWRRNVNYLEPQIPWGSMQNPTKVNQGVSVQNLYNEMRRRNWKHAGVYMLTNPNYLLADPELIKRVLVKDFQNFADRGTYYNEDVEPIGAHLFALGGKKWAKLRTKFSPTFTSSKMKIMFKTMVDCEKNLKIKMEEEYLQNRPIDIKEIVACFTTDIIGSCAFGLDCNTFKTPNSDFRKYGKEIFQLDNLRRIKFLCMFNFPKLCDIFRMKLFTEGTAKFFSQMVIETIKYREANHHYSRNDFMQSLIELKNQKNAEEPLTMNEIIAQCFVFFAAGFETSSSTMSFALYELAKNPEIQDKLRLEIEAILKKHNQEITYEGVKEMTYLQQVINGIYSQPNSITHHHFFQKLLENIHPFLTSHGNPYGTIEFQRKI